jgi:flagellar biosynthetic protein FlhB
MPDNGQEKTEAPSSRRLSEARKDGNVARSADLSAAAMLLAAVVLLQLLGLRVLGAMRSSMEAMLAGDHAANPTRIDDLGGLASYGGWVLMHAVGPLLLVTAGVGILATLAQVGPLLTVKPIAPDLKKLDPIKGVKNLFNMRAMMRLAMSLAKVILITAVSVWIIWRDGPKLAVLMQLEVGAAFAASVELVMLMAIKLAVLLLVLALLDLAYQKHQRMQDLKMTKQEVRDEAKDMEGDPQIKQRRARVARQLAMQRLNAAVPTADVVVTNPTHVAVALKYTSGEMQAPKVVAKGAELMAMRVRQLAMQSGIPLVERKELARALYAGVEVGQEVPNEHYAAVAEVLAYVYRLSGKAAA